MHNAPAANHVSDLTPTPHSELQDSTVLITLPAFVAVLDEIDGD